MLYFIPTPIGNLGDITYRAVETLKKIDLLLVEDKRITKKLLNHLSIEKPLLTIHKFNEHEIVEKIIQKLKNDDSIGFVCDSGCPGISDPGYLLARKCIDENIDFEYLPGPSSIIPALILSGFPAHNFVFEGFLPSKKGRKTKLLNLKNELRTIILFESPHRILKLVDELKEIYGDDKQISISKEITKIYESTYRGNILEVKKQLLDSTIKGEFVVVISGGKNQ